MSDPEPRQMVVPETIAAVTASTGPGAPREVALCLSYFSGANVPRRRGRIYVGPWANSVALERPDSTVMGILMDLAEDFENLGGADTDWVLYSVTDNVFPVITNYWVDNEWDTIRSRGLRGTTRLEGTTTEE